MEEVAISQIETIPDDDVDENFIGSDGDSNLILALTHQLPDD